jgi:hypothetical protein
MNLTIALSKGRILQETLPLLATAGISLRDDPDSSRKLVLDTNDAGVKVVVLRATDVPTYVPISGWRARTCCSSTAARACMSRWTSGSRVAA